MNLRLTSFFLLCIFSLWMMMPVEGNNNLPSLSRQESIEAELVYAHPGTCRTLDPAKAMDNTSALVISNIYEGLVKFCPDTNQIKPSLATGWKVTGGGLEWTFNLRQGVKFQDGTPFNAQAVKFSYQRQSTGNQGKSYFNFVYGPVKDIKIVDDYTIKFLLKYPYTPFLNNLAMPFSAPVVSPEAARKHGAEFWRHPAGTGPFELASWQEDTVLLKSNPSYWGKEPGVNSIKFIPVPGEQERMDMLTGGEAQIITGITPRAAQKLKAKGYKTHYTTGLDISYLGFYVNEAPFSYHSAREAARLALDKQKLVQDVLKGQGMPATSFIPPGLQINTPSPPEPGVDKAREILARVPVKKDITLITYRGTRPYNQAGGKALAQSVAKQLEKGGFTVNIKSYPWNEYKKALQRQEGDAFLYGWASDNGDPDNFLYPLFSSDHIKTGLNTCRFRNQEMDTLLVTAQQTPRGELRKKLYSRCLEILNEEIPAIPLNHSLRVDACAKNASNFTPHYAGWNPLSSLKFH